MEVCGGQTHSLLRYGIEQELIDNVELIHGPGCPVCVTPAEAIDFAITLSQEPDTTLISFGDMLRVPGSRESLLNARTSGGSVKTVYSPLDAVELAAKNPEQNFVFFAVGFETTAPATALAILQADAYRLENFSILVAHVRVQPAMEGILRLPDNRVQAFLGAGHVCAVAGFDGYHQLSSDWKTPIVVTGFEPIDLLKGILACVQQLESGEAYVANAYDRTVSVSGNLHAQQVIDSVYSISDRPWRGLGIIPQGGMTLRSEWRRFDAVLRYSDLIPSPPILNIIDPHNDCCSADVLSGRLRPPQCPAFGKQCLPDSPLGAPMVSSEGACAAYYRFGRNSCPV